MSNYNVFASVQDSQSNPLRSKPSSSKSDVDASFSIEGSTFGFQDQEAWTLVENEERSVDHAYVSTAVFASVQDSPSNPLRSNTSSSKSDVEATLSSTL